MFVANVREGELYQFRNHFKNHAKTPGLCTVTPQISVSGCTGRSSGAGRDATAWPLSSCTSGKTLLKTHKGHMGLNGRSEAAGARAPPQLSAPPSRPADVALPPGRTTGPRRRGGCADPPPSPRPGRTTSMSAKPRARLPLHQLGSARACADRLGAKPW